MLDIKFVRENPDAVKENIKKKFQDAKLPLVDEVIEKDAKYRACLKEVEALKAARNKLSKANGPLFGQLKKCTDEAQKAELQAQIDANNAAVKADADKMAELEKEEETLSARIQEIMYTIPQMIDPSVPIGPDDTYNVEAQRFGEPVVPDFPIPYHTEIMESFDGIDMDAAGRVAGNGFYYLLGNIARLHEAVLAYARDFMINKGFTYVIPPFMMHGNVVQGVMSFPEMDAMMYKIEGEDLYLIGIRGGNFQIFLSLLRRRFAVVEDRHRNHLVAFRQLNAADTRRIASDENAHFRHREADAFSATGRQHHVVVLVANAHVDQLVAFVQLHGNLAVRLHIHKIHQRIATHIPLTGGEHDRQVFAIILTLRQLHHRRNCLAGIKRQQVDKRLTLGGRRPQR